MKLATSVAALSASCVSAQKPGSQTTERHPKLSYQECSSSGSCNTQQGEVTIDSNWRWTHDASGTTDCYHGNKWDQSLCPDPATCIQKCVLEGADQEYTSTYGVKAQGGKLELDFVTQGPYSKNIGSRTYLMESEDKYKMFKLKNKEFTYTVDDSNLGCGLNGALYFVAMDQDGGKSKYNNAGAKYGLGYCDAQCPHDLKFINGEANILNWVSSDTDVNAGTGKYGTCCTEIDIWEANSISTAFTMHACEVDEQTRCEGTDCGDNKSDERFKGVCDKNGCDMQSRRLGTENFWGPGSSFKVDSTKPVQVTTQFITSDGTDNGKLVSVKQFYTQNGQTIEHPEYTVNGNKHSEISDDFCSDWVAVTQDGTNYLEKGGLGAVEKALEKGVVLVMSLWDDHEVNMLWLDSTYPTDGQQAGSHRGTCSTDSGVPADVESQHPNSKVIFSDIKFGPLGSTTGGPSPPSPSPSPTPTPSPIPSTGCCSWAKPDEVQECGDTTAYCKASAENCVQCDGHWIHPDTPTPSPTPTPPPAPTPSPSPSGCPGGSLSACVDLCPADIFAACAESCSKRCPHAELV